MYTEIIQTLILVMLLWIVMGVGLAYVTFRVLKAVFMPGGIRVSTVERITTEWILKVVIIKVVTNVVMRLLGKRLR